MDDDITIRGVRHDEWEIFKALRLEAVTNNLHYFGNTPEEVMAKPENDWKRRIDSEGQRMFGLFDKGQLVGITDIFIDLKKDPAGQIANLSTTYIKPEYRGRGLTALFYNARFEWALAQPGVKKITTAHRIGNEPSRRAILANGFTLTDEGIIEWPNGTIDTELCYELNVNSLKDGG